MAQIEPFRGVIYNQQKFKDLSAVVCPPYDVISPAMQQRYYQLNPHNLIRLILRNDTAGEDKYRAAGDCFRQWIKEGVLLQDGAPAVYFYSLRYKIKGETKVRPGFIALLRLEDKDTRVLRHEYTRPAPKEDRLKLLQQVRANLSPIFVVFADKKRSIAYLYERQVKEREPSIRVVDQEQNIHELWRIDAPQIIEKLQENLKREDIFIADGHHRYEVACAYRDQLRQSRGAGRQENQSLNYIMAYFTNTDPRGLSIFAIHRLVKQDERFDYANFLLKLKEYFDEEEIKEKERFFFLMEKVGCRQHVLGMYGRGQFWLLRLKNARIIDKLIFDKPREVRSLDVSILNQLVLNKILGLGTQSRENLEFSPCGEELIAKADQDSSYIAFFLNPVKIQEIMAVSLAGERMPAKSTYFYPKAISGLVINRLDEVN